LSYKVYEWFITYKTTTIRQGVLCADTKKAAKNYIFKSVIIPENITLDQYKLTVHLLQIEKG